MKADTTVDPDAVVIVPRDAVLASVTVPRACNFVKCALFTLLRWGVEQVIIFETGQVPVVIFLGDIAWISCAYFVIAPIASNHD